MAEVPLEEWLDAVNREALVSFPTDTVPALAVRPQAGDRIYQLKQRSQTKPLILMGATWSQLRPYVIGPAPDVAQWQQLANRHWPGALTLVLPASDRVPAAINPQQTGTIGLRVPNHPLARYLLERTGPLATTSVNRSGQPPLETMTAIAQTFPSVQVLSANALAQLYPALTGQPPPAADRPQGSGLPSTVARWTGSSWEILRQGAVTLQI
ncbi:L-threonylcarbamoyladenylate synthase [Nodosilinea sp. P-1105]|uniref:L-threonylcarbamoyladenylate synthase n=1 Tax=Nodosilinea sp. P-1105 TaxID=2546229 RepID=UPI00146BD748|nr:L-threonylcarbamoyladenylate synthase [Nodosilinea sp. P-1105]NMF85000.1 Sua5/YciO/YrdC/YwlC family protein [Nodosilinea sp. P-1105]